MTHEELNEALSVLGLPRRATLRMIKSRHRELVRRYHPDSGEGSDPERIRAINAAYKVIRDYVDDYRYSFAEDEFYEQNPDERLRRQFADAPLWGSK
ncbi:MAG: molecular chaperone DnaJ [Geobacter sp.]|nr:MAG: molecular chaperone DnaJ [Geobacter sp.]